METTDTKKVILSWSEYEYLKSKEEEANQIKAELLKEDKDRKYIVIKTRDPYYNFPCNKSMQIWSEAEVLNDAQREIDNTNIMLKKANDTIEFYMGENREKTGRINHLYNAVVECKGMTFAERVFKWRKTKKRLEDLLK